MALLHVAHGLVSDLTTEGLAENRADTEGQVACANGCGREVVWRLLEYLRKHNGNANASSEEKTVVERHERDRNEAELRRE